MGCFAITQWAEKLATDEPVELKLENLQLFSNGIFANVYRGSLIYPEQRMVAVKKFWSDKDEGLQANEVRILMDLNKYHHSNIIELLYVFSHTYSDHKTCTSLVFEFFPASLYNICKGEHNMDMLDIKLYTWQLFCGQAHLEQHKICHRDIKPQNLLVDHQKGLLKIGDFGSSKIINKGTISHPYHVTRYYRAPELILGSETYNYEIDRWSCGCVFGELLNGHILLAGKTTNHQLQLIISILGTPNDEDITAMKVNDKLLQTEDFVDYQKKHPTKTGFGKILHKDDEQAIKLINKVLVYKPSERLNGPKFLGDSFFAELFDPCTKRNGKCLTTLTRQDLAEAIGENHSPVSSTSTSPSSSRSDESLDDLSVKIKN